MYLHSADINDESPQAMAQWRAWDETPRHPTPDVENDFVSGQRELLAAAYLVEEIEKAEQAARERWYETDEYLALESACDNAIDKYKIARQELAAALGAFSAAYEAVVGEVSRAATPAKPPKYTPSAYVPSYPVHPTPPGLDF